jgi:hypothetical protein
MSRKKELQRQLGSRYSYERLLNDREIQKLRREIPEDFSETVTAALTAGCLRLNTILYRSCRELLLGYDVFVKDDPDSPEWIFYDSLSEPVSFKEADMIRILDRLIAEHGLSYTESCFKRLDGKAVQKEKDRL